MKSLILAVLLVLQSVPALSAPDVRFPLHEIVKRSDLTLADLKEVKRLVRSGAVFVNQKDSAEQTPLMILENRLYTANEMFGPQGPILEKIEKFLISKGAVEWPDGEPDWDIRHGPGIDDSPCSRSLDRWDDRSKNLSD
jgi:hypothetical protein